LTAVATVGGSPVTQIREINGSDGYCSQALEAHFGLGDAMQVDTLTVRWPSGGVQILTGVGVDTLLEVVEEAEVGVVDLPPAASSLAWLGKPRPNPFGAATAVPYSLESAAKVRLRVVDSAGRLVRELWNGTANAGRHRAVWDGFTDAGRRAAGGVYFVRLEVGEGVLATRKLVLLR
jgi:hypothetical protein